MQEISKNKESSYETVIVFSLKGGEEVVSGLVEKFKNLLSTSAKLDSVDEWGKRHLVYPINKENEAHYVLFKFKSSVDFPLELDRICGITEGVLRSLIVNLDESEHHKNRRSKRKSVRSVAAAAVPSVATEESVATDDVSAQTTAPEDVVN
jgi:small subunit ribosomal protein S6